MGVTIAWGGTAGLSGAYFDLVRTLINRNMQDGSSAGIPEGTDLVAAGSVVDADL